MFLYHRKVVDKYSSVIDQEYICNTILSLINIIFMSYIKLLILAFFIQISYTSSAQDFSEVNYPMSAYGSDLDYGFLGGLVNPNLSNIDFNNDGAMDLFVFDRNGNRIYTFVHTGEEGIASFEHAPQYESVFPENLHDWALLVDYDGDGIQDLFSAPTNNSNGISVWKGSVTNGVLSFELLRFPDDPEETILYFDFPLTSGNIQRRSIYVSFNVDIPAITDMDGDGDVDILAFEQGGSYLQYHRNLSVENNLGLDNMHFELGETCWGKIKEGDLDATITLNADDDILNTPCLLFTSIASEEPLATERHSGSSVTAFDGDGDGDVDVVLGDIGSSELIYLRNGGDADFARVDQQVKNWPLSEGGVNQYIFPVAHFLDINNDGKRDLVSTTITKESGINLNHIWYYENVNTDDAPDFQLNRKNFLMEETINIGRFTIPTFVDYNADGLMDIVVGNGGYRVDAQNSTIGLHLFENVGTSTEPAFELIDDDYLGFSELLDFSNRLAPAFGDLDGDGDVDLLVGDQTGRLYHFDNQGGAGQPLEFNGYTYEYMDIRPGNRVAPQMIDLNKDGLMDIVVGEDNLTNGAVSGFETINYFENVGTVGSPMFVAEEEIEPNSTGLIAFEENFDKGFRPYFFQGEDELLMFTGSTSGVIRVWDNYNDQTGLFEMKDDFFGDLKVGRTTYAAVHDIDNDGFLEVLVGSSRGGMDFYNTTYSIAGLDTGIDNQPLVEASIFPNPTKGFFQIHTEELIDNVMLFDVTGRQVNQWNQDTSDYSVEHLQPGTYFVRIATKDGRASMYKLLVN